LVGVEREDRWGKESCSEGSEGTGDVEGNGDDVEEEEEEKEKKKK